MSKGGKRKNNSISFRDGILTNRKCYGMEIDPHYCDVIVKRWEEYTGNKSERVERAEG